jgi:hypothetical protein
MTRKEQPVAQLPGERYLIQQIDNKIILFERYTEREIAKWDASDPNAFAKAQKTIYDSDLTDEEKCFAYFWSGYFYGCAIGA